MNLTKYEKETIILFNDAEDIAEVYTCNSALIRRLDGFCSKTADCVAIKENECSKVYNLPKKWVRIQKPPAYSEETRQKLIDNLNKKPQGVINYAR